MVFLMMASTAVSAAALFFVLDRPVARDKRRNTVVSGTLLSLGVVALVAGLAYAAAAWSSS